MGAPKALHRPAQPPGPLVRPSFLPRCAFTCIPCLCMPSHSRRYCLLSFQKNAWSGGGLGHQQTPMPAANHSRGHTSSSDPSSHNQIPQKHKTKFARLACNGKKNLAAQLQVLNGVQPQLHAHHLNHRLNFIQFLRVTCINPDRNVATFQEYGTVR